MKEATGELNMTVITIVAIAAIAAFFYMFVWPGIQRSVSKNQCASEWGVKAADVVMSDKCTCACQGENCQKLGVTGEINLCLDQE